MSSTAMSMGSSEGTWPEESAGETTPKSSASSDKPTSVKKEVSKSPTPEPRPKGSQAKKGTSSKAASASSTEEGAETSSQQQSSSRKKRARATPSEDPETNGRKSATECSGRESSLWPGVEGEGPVQGSLLEEVLAEKRMALMRSPQVIQFLQQRQVMIQAAQQHGLLHPHTNSAPQFCVGEVEEDANS
ncbi:uncharacterized protein LOC143298896 [Babylonia areolata]|uniref:uncharacterized protein LOC143298896 n=1 Tax=Babylonia areolata TaxID=304850 RepID=UPI003FD61488